MPELSKKDFQSDNEVRWCPGCGDYSILAVMQKLLPELGIPKENHVFVSGIGCSSRFPYYMNTYGFHTIHGRAPAVASGVKISNPELCVWVVTGDGDGLSIGGNHLLHTLRRNVDLNILLFNNRIYGLTKGQYSPTSEIGKVTKSTPFGSVDRPVNPLLFALSAGATFVARALDVDAKGLTSVLKQAQQHRGTSFVEIYQNCNVFNDGTHAYMSERKIRKERQLELKAGEIMSFGDNQDKAISLEGLDPKVVSIDSAKGLPKFDPSNLSLAMMLARLEHPKFPTPMGVIYQDKQATYDSMINTQVEEAQLANPASLQDLLHGGDCWEV